MTLPDRLMHHFGSDEAHKRFWGLLDARVLELGDGRTRLEIPVAKHWLNLNNAVHGGASAGWLDQVAGLATNTLCGPGEVFVTATANLQYRRPFAPDDGPALASAEVTARTGRKATTRARIANRHGDVTLEGEFLFILTARRETVTQPPAHRAD
ncbi:PaaI family thioesterase [Glycocaulis sp.]|uniref:PaaI family thioesterase n=1 Tax=Glycocaulis sp. TaxID=1969725 RepID=UPI003D1E0917